MKARDLFMQTLPFCWMKLGLGLLKILIDVILLGILVGISLLFGNDGVTGFMIIIWLGLIGVVNFAVKHYLGYLVKAGHVAVIANSFKDGKVPDNCIAVGKDMVKERFGTANVYFLIDKAISGAVKQIQSVFGRITDGLFGALPGSNSMKSVIDLFIKLSLDYIDECCLGYTFYQKDQNAYKSACDGVVIYAQNWKVLLKNAAKTALTVILALVVITLISFVIFAALFKLFGLGGFAAFIIAILFAATVKYAFIDSWMMVNMMHSYMKVAPETNITFDLYTKLCGLSRKFRDMFKKSGMSETDSPSQVAQIQEPIQEPKLEPTVETSSESINITTRPKFCAECGSPLADNVAYCSNCGKKVE